MSRRARPLVALTQGDPAGIGPEICCREVERWLAASSPDYQLLLLMERAALTSVEPAVPQAVEQIAFTEHLDELAAQSRSAGARGQVLAIEPTGADRERTPVEWGRPGAADARGALKAIEQAVDLCIAGQVDAMVTAPVSKVAIAEHVDASFTGHTDTIAARCSRALSAPTEPRSPGSEIELKYGRDYLMAFAGDALNVALLSTHVPLRAALDYITEEHTVEALLCLDRAIRNSGLDGRRIALAGLNPHAGEGGLLGTEDDEILTPAVSKARALGVDVVGPESADTLFMRARRGEFDWVLALYHDQGLIAVKTSAFGAAVNWTAGLPLIRTSVDHGTAYALAGQGVADPTGLFSAVDFAVRLALEA